MRTSGPPHSKIEDEACCIAADYRSVEQRVPMPSSEVRAVEQSSGCVADLMRAAAALERECRRLQLEGLRTEKFGGFEVRWWKGIGR